MKNIDLFNNTFEIARINTFLLTRDKQFLYFAFYANDSIFKSYLYPFVSGKYYEYLNIYSIKNSTFFPLP